jgi:lipopolysaccharide assembly outer membrane protein LptD (OstA)
MYELLKMKTNIYIRNQSICPVLTFDPQLKKILTFSVKDRYQLNYFICIKDLNTRIITSLNEICFLSLLAAVSIMKQWKWFETTVLEIHKKKTCFYFLVQYAQKCINFNQLSHKPIKWKQIYILGINHRGHVITLKRK